MSWLFGKKKVLPKVPFPEGHPLDEKTLRFPGRFRERVIEPEQVKAAVGMEKDFFPEEEVPEAEEPIMPKKASMTIRPPSLSLTPVHLKVEVYQKILGELDSMRTDLTKLQESANKVQSSEYNEEHNLSKLKKHMRGLHDQLLNIDKRLFKTQE